MQSTCLETTETNLVLNKSSA